MKILVTIPDGAVKDSFLNEETNRYLELFIQGLPWWSKG